MKSKGTLLKLVLLILGTYFLIKGLVVSTTFLVPLVFASLLTLICIPLSRKIERIGIPKGLASFICVAISLIAFLTVFVVISVQIKNISDRWPEAKENLKPKLEQLQSYILDKTGINTQDQMNIIYGDSDSESSDSSGSITDEQSSEMINQDAKKKIGLIVIDFFGFVGNTMLSFIYLFFLLLYRRKVKLSILEFFDPDFRKQAREVMTQSIQLAENFLVGRLILILFLAIFYSIGMSIAGLENAILIAVITALLSLFPYIGNVIGYILAISLALFGGVEFWALIVISITYGLAQFIESYILEPYVVGDKVGLNPLVTIIVVVLGSSIWGLSGMILSIPVVGILKIIFDATDGMRPIGYALGDEDIGDPKKQGVLSKLGENIWNKFKGKSE